MVSLFLRREELSLRDLKALPLELTFSETASSSSESLNSMQTAMFLA